MEHNIEPVLSVSPDRNNKIGSTMQSVVHRSENTNLRESAAGEVDVVFESETRVKVASSWIVSSPSEKEIVVYSTAL